MRDDLLGRVSRALDAMRASNERRAFHVPGRIEVLGKHTDYAGGRSVLSAVGRGIVIGVAPRPDSLLRLRNADASPSDGDGDLTTPYRADAGASVTPATGWLRYATTVIGRVSRDFPNARAGADIACASNLPMDSGLSSSSAFVVALFLALDAVNGIASAFTTREVLAGYLGAVENGRSFGLLEAARGVGTLGGSEDHTAILCCRADTLSRYSFCPVRSEGTIPMPPSRVFVVAFSGVAAAKAGNALEKYNEASRATEEIVRVWNEATGRRDGTLGDALETDTDADEGIRSAIRRSRPQGFSVQRLLDRLEHFNAESRHIIPSACEALRHEDLDAFGALVDRSQANAERLLGNQVPETMALVRAARALGADAASAFGGGFGGSVWAMTRAAAADTFMAAWRDRYASEFPSAAPRAILFTTGCHNGASEIL